MSHNSIVGYENFDRRDVLLGSKLFSLIPVYSFGVVPVLRRVDAIQWSSKDHQYAFKFVIFP